MSAKVSIVVPVYNVKNWLSRCLESLVHQTYENIEIILINDGSTDDSPQICKNYADCYPKIKYFSKKNGGLSDARNFGLEKISGEFFLFVDSDDYLKKEAIEVLVNEMNKYNLDILSCNTTVTEINGNIRQGINIKKKFSKVMRGEEFLIFSLKNNQYHSPACGKLYRTELIKNNHLYFIKGIFHEDEEWTPRVLLAAQRVKLLDYGFYHYVLREGSITHQKDFNKNINDIMWISESLMKYIRNKDNNQNLNIFRKYLIEIYLDWICIDWKYVELYKNKVNPHFLKENANSFYLKIRVILFLKFPKFYYKFRYTEKIGKLYWFKLKSLFRQVS